MGGFRDSKGLGEEGGVLSSQQHKGERLPAIETHKTFIKLRRSQVMESGRDDQNLISQS